MDLEMKVSSFKIIPSKNYRSLSGFLRAGLGLLLILLGNTTLYISLIKELYSASYFLPIEFYILGTFFIVIGLGEHFLNKKARYHSLQFDKEKDVSGSNYTFCRRCGVTISSEIFNISRDKLIKPIHFLNMRGYFCKLCFKNYSKNVFLLFLIFSILNGFLMYAFSLILSYNFLIFIIVFLLVPILIYSQFKYRLRKYRWLAII